MAEHPNATVVRQAMDAFNANDTEAIGRLLADDIEWHEIGMAKPIVGMEALGAHYMGDARPDYEITTTLHDVVANDDHVVALVEAHATRGGREFTYRTAEIYHVRNGQISARWAFSDDTAAINEFFG